MTDRLDCIMLVYNVQELAVHALMHLMACTPVPLRFIIVDNGSDPPIAPRLRPWLGDSHVYIRHETNQGVYGPTNAALALVESDWVIWCSTDHLVFPGWFPPLAHAMKQFGMVWAAPEYLEEGPFRLGEMWEAMTPVEEYRVALGQLGSSCLVLDWSKLKDTIGGFDERFAIVFGDTDYMERMRAADVPWGTVLGSKSRHLASQTCRTIGPKAFAEHERRDAAVFVDKWKDDAGVMERHKLAKVMAGASQEDREIAITGHWNDDRFNPKLGDLKAKP